MPKVESTILDYTKSVEELRLFELSEKCHEIAHEYELYNIQNGIYEAFGEWFLEKAKDSYSTEFGSCDLSQIVYSKTTELPEFHAIEYQYGDYEKCKDLRGICIDVQDESNYAWYTMWRIAKAYNGKYGCVVTDPPHISANGSSLFSMHIDWSQDSIDCTTNEKWRREAEKEELGIIKSGILGVFCWCFIWMVRIFLEICFCDKIQSLHYFFIPVVPVFFVFAFPVRNFSIQKIMKKLSKEFVKHCKNIEQTKYSKFDVKNGKILRY